MIRTLESRTKTCLHDRPRAPTLQRHRSGPFHEADRCSSFSRRGDIIGAVLPALTCGRFLFQARRVQPSVPELSLLMDGSFTSTHRAPLPPPPSGKSAQLTQNSSSSSPALRSPPHPPPHHSTPSSNLQKPCTCCATHSYNCTSLFSSPGLHPAPPAAFSQHLTPPPPPSVLHPAPSPPSHSQHTLPHLSSPHPAAAPPTSVLPTSPSSTRGSPLCSYQHTPTPLSNHTAPAYLSPSSLLSSHPPAPPPPCPLHLPPAVLCDDHTSSPLPSHQAVVPAPPPVIHCSDQMGGVVPTDAYQLLLQQDRQLRLLQAQVDLKESRCHGLMV